MRLGWYWMVIIRHRSSKSTVLIMLIRQHCTIQIMLIKKNCKKKWWSGRMAEDYGFHGKRSRSWRWWQKTTDVLVKMFHYWSATEINALDVLKAYSYTSWVIQSIRQLSQGCVRVRRHRQFSPAREVVECTWVHQCRRPYTQTIRQTNTQTPRQTDRQ